MPLHALRVKQWEFLKLNLPIEFRYTRVNFKNELLNAVLKTLHLDDLKTIEMSNLRK